MRLYGKNPVLERVKTDPGCIKNLYLQKRTELSEIVLAAKEAGLRFESVEKKWFDTNCPGVHTQGVAADVPEFQYSDFDDIVKDCLEQRSVPVFLDGVTDPQNLGAILRNLACLGGFSIVLPEHRSALINETVLRVANGGENYVKIGMVTNIATTIKKLRDEDIWITGAVVDDSVDITSVEFRYPMAIVIGSEGKGIRPGVQKCLDERISLPMHGAQLSYNVAVATSLFCYEVNRRDT